MDWPRLARFGFATGLCITLTLCPPAGAEQTPTNNGSTVTTSGRRTETGGSVTVGAQQHIPTSGRTAHRGGGVATTTCSYRTIDAAPFGPGQATGPSAQPVAALIWRTCADAATGAAVGLPTLVPGAPGAAAAPVDPVPDLVDLATANIDIDLPIPQFSPPGATLPNVDTYLWTAPTPDPTASASAAGVTVTVTATPVGTRYRLLPGDRPSADDGRIIDCDGRPAPYDAGRPVGGQPSRCRHRFRAPTRDLEVDVTATWHLTWTATNGERGDLGRVARTVTVPYRVQAAVTVIR